MRNFLLLLMMLALPAFCADPKADVEKAERGWSTGVVQKDLALLGQVLADSLTYTHSTGAVDTKASYIDSVKTGKAKYEKIEYDQLDVRVLTQDTAIAICRAKMMSMQKDGKVGPTHLSFLHVFVKGKAGWQMVAHQSAKLPD